MYRDELARIPHLGFSESAESAAPRVIELLQKHGADKVVELGCGSGVLARARAHAIDAPLEKAASRRPSDEDLAKRMDRRGPGGWTCGVSPPRLRRTPPIQPARRRRSTVRHEAG